MKKYNYFLPIASFGLLITLTCLFSCNTYHSEFPQPVDVKNSNQFPKSLRGIWRQTEKGEEIIITIDKNILTIPSMNGRGKIFNGVLDSAGKKNHEGLKHIIYNEQKLPKDTIEDYIINGNRIYSLERKNNEVKLFPGMPFALRNDTLYTSAYFPLKLGSDCLLRKISNDRYILNLKEGNLFVWLNETPTLWRLVIIMEKSPDGRLIICAPDYPDDELSLVYRNESNRYYNNQWTQKDLIKIMGNKTFSMDTLFNMTRKK